MTSPRAALLADTAIALLADRGMRGLTHRAVDQAAGLPPGSCSNLARTRAALLELTLTRLTELERRRFGKVDGLGGAERLGAPGDASGAGEVGGPSRDALADVLARLLWIQLTEGRRHTLARYELALEATRRPELRVIYDEAGRVFRAAARDLMAAAGSPDPDAHGQALVAFAEGLMFDAIAGAGAEPSPGHLRAAVAAYLAGVLPGVGTGAGQDTGSGSRNGAPDEPQNGVRNGPQNG